MGQFEWIRQLASAVEITTLAWLTEIQGKNLQPLVKVTRQRACDAVIGAR